MERHVKNYMKAGGYCIEDVIMCEHCNEEVASSVHHIDFRSQLGSDEAWNLIALGPVCDDKAHKEEIKKEVFFEIVKRRNWK